MSQFKLPMGEFIELNENEVKDFQNQDLMQIDVTGDIGFYIYCGIKPIGPKVIGKTDLYPLLLPPMNIHNNHLSNCSQDLLKDKIIKLANNNSK